MEAEIADNAQEAMREVTMSFMALGKATPRALGKRQKYISPSPDKGASKRKSFVAHKSKRYTRNNTGSGNSSLAALVVNAIKEDEEMGDDDDDDDDDDDENGDTSKPSTTTAAATAMTTTTTTTTTNKTTAATSKPKAVTKPSDVTLKPIRAKSAQSEFVMDDDDDDDVAPTPPGAEGCCTIA